MQKTFTVSTKPMKDAAAKDTILTIDWDGMSPEDLIALASQTLVIKLQTGWRKNGIPAQLTVKATDHKVGTRAPALTLEQQLAALSPEHRKALLQKYGIAS